MVKVHQTNELSKLTLRLWLGKVTHCLHLVLERCNSIVINVMAEETEAILAKKTLVGG